MDSTNTQNVKESAVDSSGSCWVFTPSFPASRPSTSKHFVVESTKLRYKSKRHAKRPSRQNLARQILASHKLRKPLSQNLAPKSLIAQSHSPQNPPPKHHRHIITLGIGANLGTTHAICKRFAHLLGILTRSKSCTLLATSPIWYNPPFGYANQPYFYNATITLRTSLSIVELFARVFYLERRFGRGRKRAFKNAPRTLDIDIIFYDKVIIKRPYLTIPHHGSYTRDSVLLPLGFILGH